MIEYTEQAQMVDALRVCGTTGECVICPARPVGRGYACEEKIMRKAADMIEAQYRRIEELKQEITEKGKEIEDLTREIMTYPDEEVEREERCGL